MPGDRLSVLPDDVTDLILSRLPIKEAVRTSILSRKWRYKWTTIPDIVFDRRTFTNAEDGREIVDTVNRILLTHNGNIRKFHFYITLSPFIFELTPWFHALKKSNIQDINFCSEDDDEAEAELPSYSFHCETLTSLSISMYVLRLPSQFRGLPNLKDLRLSSVNFVNNGSIEELVSSCPLLSRLVLDECHGFQALEIHAPNLLTLRYYGDSSSICLSHTPSLINVTLWVNEPIGQTQDVTENQNGTNLMYFLNKLLEVQVLDINELFLQYLSINFVEPNPSIILSRLKTLKVWWSLECLQQTTTVLYLLKSSPILERLTISWININAENILVPIGDFWTASSNVDWKFNHLRFLTLRYMFESESWMKFIEHVLEPSPILEHVLGSSPILEQVKIEFCVRPASEEVQWIRERLLSMCRASPNPTIII